MLYGWDLKGKLTTTRCIVYTLRDTHHTQTVTNLAILTLRTMHTCTLPQICADRLNALGEDFYYQDIDNAHSTEVNIDYYSVEITQMPDFNDDGHPDNQVEFMDAIKANILSLASGSQNGF